MVPNVKNPPMILLLSLALYITLPASSVLAAQTTGAILGAIKDQNGAVLPGVSVTATNELTNLTRSVIADSNGNYTLPLLPVGKYTLTAELTGFKKYVQTGIVLEVNQNARVDITLLVGAVTEAITVEAGAQVVDTTTSALEVVLKGISNVCQDT